MKPVRIKKTIKKAWIHRLILSATIGIASVLLVAAYGKWFYPAELLTGWDRGISIFELLFVGVLFYFRNSFKVWVLAAFVFASWGGYAGFWYQLHIPCSCMGEMLHIPTGLSLFLDTLFFILALQFIYWLGGLKRGVYLAVALGAVGASLGFFLASGIYRYVVN